MLQVGRRARFNEVSGEEIVEKLTGVHGRVSHLHLNDCEIKDDELVQVLQKHKPTFLSLLNCHHLTVAIQEDMKSIEFLRLGGCTQLHFDQLIGPRMIKMWWAYDDDLRSVASNKLMTLYLGNSHELLDDGMLALGMCHNLEIFELDNCSRVTDNGLIGGLNGLGKLQSLTLNSVNIGNQGLRWISQNLPLISLKLGNLVQVTDHGLGLIHQLVSLKLLHIWNLQQVTSSGFKSLFTVGNQLTSLVLEVSGFDDTVVLKMARFCHDLVFLSLIYCWNLTDQSLIALIRGCHKLEYLMVGSRSFERMFGQNDFVCYPTSLVKKNLVMRTVFSYFTWQGLLALKNLPHFKQVVCTSKLFKDNGEFEQFIQENPDLPIFNEFIEDPTSSKCLIQ